MILKGRIHIKYKPTAKMVADELTKSLVTIKFE